MVPACLFHPPPVVHSNLVKCTSYEIFFSLLSFLRSWVGIFSAEICSQTPSVYDLLSLRPENIRVLCILIFKLLDSRQKEKKH
jgi:hypothetical protein